MGEGRVRRRGRSRNSDPRDPGSRPRPLRRNEGNDGSRAARLVFEAPGRGSFAFMACSSSLPLQGTRVGLVATLVGGLLACSTPALDRGTAPQDLATSRPAVSAMVPLPEAASATATAAPSAPAPPVESAEVPVPASAEVEAPSKSAVPVSPADSPASARGQCSGWDTLRTKRGEVSCYPYRCRAGRCLSSCKTREDCAGSLGPGDMAEHGWPLDCAPSSATCFPLSPDHVRSR